MIPNAALVLFKIHGLVSKELFWINQMDPSSFLHKVLCDLLVCGKVAAIPRKESQKTMRVVAADHEVCHFLIIIKVLTTQRTLEFDPHEAEHSATDSMMRALTLDTARPNQVRGQIWSLRLLNRLVRCPVSSFAFETAIFV